MKLGNQPWIAEPRTLPIPPPPHPDYTYLIDGPTGSPVKRLPPGTCLCRACFPERFVP